MRRRIEILILGFALTVGWMAPASAQVQFVKVPIGIENLVLATPGTPDQPLSLPVDANVNLASPCGSFPRGRVRLSVVNNGIDISMTGNPNGCEARATLRFDVVLEVPVVSTDPVAFVWLMPEAGAATLVNTPWVPGAKGGAGITFTVQRSATSSQLPLPFETETPAVGYTWTTDPTTLNEGTSSVRAIPMLAGDQLRIPVVAEVGMSPASGGGDLTGDISARFEFKTPLPLAVSGLSSSLSIPIGVIGLTGLARLRG